MVSTRVRFLSLLMALSLSAAACGGSSTVGADPCAGANPCAGQVDPCAGADPCAAKVSGDVKVDGSSTVFPISEAMAEEFMADNGGAARVTVGVSGSGGGFKKFCAGETDISNASRPIKQKEIDLCAENGIEFIEVPIAFDGLSVVVNPENEWAACMTAEQLAAMWAPSAEEAVTQWNQVDDSFPDSNLALYGPGTDSGTYDYFKEATVEELTEEKGTRGDFTASEDDNVIVQGVSSDPGGIGFFGFAYYEENKDSLKVVPIENANGDCVEPSGTTIEDGSYNPLSRPIFFYVKTSSYEENPAVKAFVDYQLDPANGDLISEVGYVAIPGELMDKVQARVEGGTTGSIFGGGSSVGVKLSEKL